MSPEEAAHYLKSWLWIYLETGASWEFSVKMADAQVITFSVYDLPRRASDSAFHSYIL